MGEPLSPSIKNMIYSIRGRRVMLDRDLASFYNVETKVLKQAVKRNDIRFPEDFCFQLTDVEEKILRSQIVTSRLNWGGSRYSTLVFTELGIAMLSSVLKSDEAIKTNIAIMRTFFELRDLLGPENELGKKVEKIEKDSTELFRLVFHRLEKLEGNLPILSPKRRKIGI